MRQQTVNSLNSIATAMTSNATHVISSNALQPERANLYRECIERMSPAEIAQAYLESDDQPIWQESLQIYGSRRVRKLMRRGDSSAIEASKRLN